ncbi:hypothetical protein CROQUDRAFT_654781 [Cronartium quercuum f. sp. fusiforme G11]|uniref:Uncharacterized protein n=1 Tax=Cronartium quercuum f. sp. fusiforme G11 TaxID=708437 RepID=A0A9P6TDM3_9BASI|nr:hypothetical protein CROQUDRAFT_654781 [Cronartium quercuum f. sp. fusiforme G11]
MVVKRLQAACLSEEQHRRNREEYEKKQEKRITHLELQIGAVRRLDGGSKVDPSTNPTTVSWAQAAAKSTPHPSLPTRPNARAPHLYRQLTSS